MKSPYVYVCPMLLIGLASAPLAQADELADWLKIDGFGTIGAYKGNSDAAGVRVDTRQSSYSKNEWRFDGDTQASIQATLNHYSKRSGVELRFRTHEEGSLRLKWFQID